MGDLAPDFDLPASGNRRVTREALLGRPFVLYFYPRAGTPGCTAQARAFGEVLAPLLPVIGVSRDAMAAIETSAARLGTGFPLASDPAGAAAAA